MRLKRYRCSAPGCGGVFRLWSAKGVYPERAYCSSECAGGMTYKRKNELVADRENVRKGDGGKTGWRSSTTS